MDAMAWRQVAISAGMTALLVGSLALAYLLFDWWRGR